MAVLTEVICPKKQKYKTTNGSEEAVGMTSSSNKSYPKGKHLSPMENVKLRNYSACSKRNCIIVLTLVVSVALNVVLSICLWRNRSSTDTKTDTPYSAGLVSAVHEGSVCTVCSSFGVQTKSVNTEHFHELSVHIISGGVSLCCMRNAHGLRYLISLFAERYRLARPPDKVIGDTLFNRQSTGAHLYVDSEALKTHPPSLFWSKKYGYGSAFNSEDIPVIDNNRLHITKPGLYHIYSFITFKTEQTRLRPDNVFHTINRRNKHLPELGSHVILIDKTTLPEVSEKFLTSFLSATVRLRQDDQLFVEVSNLSYVYNYAPSNFFGLYYVGK